MTEELSSRLALRQKPSVVIHDRDAKFTKQFVVIRVRDNGIAIEQLPRIFEMFTQVDTSLERSVGGLGIGLSLVKSLVELHSGTIEVHSASIGQGSEFVVRLPILAATPEPPT